MAVYTHLSTAELQRYARRFGLGRLLRARGVPAGTINTIYDVRTTRGRFILRILENRPARDARFEAALLRHIEARGLAVPRLIAAGSSASVPLGSRQHLSCFDYLPGRELAVQEIRARHAGQIGEFLAALHLAARGLRRRRANHFDPPRVRRILARCMESEQPAPMARDLRLLRRELDGHGWPESLPRGIVHGDLFVDNARFARGRLCGVLDFEMAASGPLVYDLAVAIDDWAFPGDLLSLPRARALVRGYLRQRALGGTERAALYSMCRYAAVRFAVTRFFDFEVRERPGAHRLYKDYKQYMQRLASLRRVGRRLFETAVLGPSR